MKFRFKKWLSDSLNKFCFSNKHDDYCNGCPFKRCKKCPVDVVVKAIWGRE